ncbi:transglutaminase-like cysteine peptidase [Bosea lathyri]|nr:transglutaminase-like cysteine peptidase [Bosea lathyri]
MDCGDVETTHHRIALFLNQRLACFTDISCDPTSWQRWIMMIGASVARLAVGVALFASWQPGHARADQLAAVMRGRASPPAAFVNFCGKHPSECRQSGALTRIASLSPERQRDLDEVNAQVNATITEMSDMDHFGREDVWSIPTDGRGDCEDFALLKRKLLIQRGWASSTLLITVVGTPSGEGHAVLTVVTSSGDFVLDNKTSRILLWSQTGYLFFTRMSQANPRAWESIDGGSIRATAATRHAFQPLSSASR